MFTRIRAVLLAIALAGALYPAAAHYDLGGPCEDQPGLSRKGINEAEKNGDWARLVELEKQQVRAGCGNQYRWDGLAAALLKANRRSEATQVLDEMYARGFEPNPSMPGTSRPEVVSFMKTPEFKASPVGQKIEELKRTSDRRRAGFRKMLNSLPANQRPPDNYVAKGACPFECCRFGDWTAREDTVLVAEPGSKRIVGKVMAGGRVEALTGEVHLKPEPVGVLLDGDLPKDRIAFILDYGGEGYGNVYSRGKTITTFLGYAEYCFRPSEVCWGETILPRNQRQEPVWWVKVKLMNGLIGWTSKAENFDGKDGCG